MKNLIENPKVIATTLTVLLFASVIWLLNERSNNSTLEDGLNNEKLKTESLLSEKLLLEKDMAKFKNQLTTLSGKNGELDKVLKQTSQKLEAKESEFNKVKKENMTLQQIKKQHNELLSLRKDMEKQIETMSVSIRNLQQENSNLTNSVAFLEQRNKLLNDELQKAMLASVDYTQLDAIAKNKKLTVKAKKISKLIATFDVPAELKNLSFRITDQSGKTLSAQEGTTASRVIGNSNNYTASTSTALDGFSSKLNKVEMVYIPTKKLKPGTYKVEILNDNLYVGSLQVGLR